MIIVKLFTGNLQILQVRGTTNLSVILKMSSHRSLSNLYQCTVNAHEEPIQTEETQLYRMGQPILRYQMTCQVSNFFSYMINGNLQELVNHNYQNKSNDVS